MLSEVDEQLVKVVGQQQQQQGCLVVEQQQEMVEHAEIRAEKVVITIVLSKGHIVLTRREFMFERAWSSCKVARN